MADEMNDLVEVQETQDFGKAVVAKCDLVPGSLGLGFREKALIIFPPCDDRVLPPWGSSARVLKLQSWTDYLHFMKQEKDVQAKVLSFYAELDCADARIVNAFVTPYLDSPESAKIFTHLTMVVKFNSVTMQPANADGSASASESGYHFDPHGLFEVASRLAHSCRPNCVWFTSQDGQHKTVRFIQPVEKGEVLTVSYLPEKMLQKPMFVRRSMLLEFRNFHCHCKRCMDGHGDDSRRFGCHNKKCRGHHMVKQMEEDDLPEFLVCSLCGERAPADFQERMLENEEEARDAIDYIDRVIDGGFRIDIKAKLLSLKPPHASHAVALPIYRGQAELFEQMQRWPKAISVQRQWIKCRLNLHGEDYLDECSGFAYERLGDLLVKEGDWRGAQKAYRNAVRALQIARGGSSEPYTLCAMNKLITVQKKLPTNKSETSCGLCGVFSTKKCGQCGLAVYCNRDHQTVHWKVHKLSCGKSV